MQGVNRNKCKYTHSPSFTLTVSSLRGRARLINLSLAKCPPSKDDSRICPRAYVIFVSEHFQYFNQNFCPLLNLIINNEQNHCKNENMLIQKFVYIKFLDTNNSEETFSFMYILSFAFQSQFFLFLHFNFFSWQPAGRRLHMVVRYWKLNIQSSLSAYDNHSTKIKKEKHFLLQNMLGWQSIR